jgi:hypothetical protein
MFFAIHNPKMEDYMQKKTQQQNTRDIIKNMIKRRHYTSTIVFQLYTYAYTNEGNVSVIYPKDKDNIANQLIKSFQSNHLKTTAVLLRKAAPAPALAAFIEYIMTTQPVVSTAASASVMNKINNHISYHRKDIIILALTCYMKIDEEDINKKNIFIAATEEESEEQRDEPRDEPRKEQRDEPRKEQREEPRDPSPHPPPSPYNAKYKYLYR